MKEKSFKKVACRNVSRWCNWTLLSLILLLGSIGNASAQISVFPHMEDFEDENQCAPICLSVCPLQGTFRNAYTDDLDFVTDRAGTPSGSTGPAIDHTTNSSAGNYLYVETSCLNQGYPNKRSDLLSAYYDFSALTGPLQMGFWYHMYGIHMGILTLDVDTTEGSGPWITDIITPFSENLNEWQYKFVDLSDYLGEDSVRFRFRYLSGTNYAGDLALDDIDIFEPQSNDFQVTNILDLRNSCSLSDSETVAVTVFNHSPDTLLPGDTLSLTYQNGTQSPVTETFTLVDTFFTYHSLDFTFGQSADFSVIGDYQISAWVHSLPLGDLHNEKETVGFSNISSVAQFPYCQDFETDYDLWSWGGRNTSWAWGAPQKTVINSAYSGANCMMNGGLGGQYNNGENNWIMGPCYDLTNTCRPQVQFWAWWDSEFEWDGTVMQYSTNDGASWIRLGALGDPHNWYTSNDIYSRPGGNQTHGWTGSVNDTLSSGGWVRCKRTFYSLAGQSAVQLRFAFASDFDRQEDGFAFDDFAVSDGVFLGKDRSICAGDTLILDADSVSGDSYLWSSGATTQTISVTQPGIYWVEVTNNAYCPTRDTIEIVSIGSNFAVALGPDLSGCGTVAIDAGFVPGVTYSWSNGGVGQIIQVDSSGTYWVDVLTPCGTTRSDSIQITVLPNPVLDLGSDTVGCGSLTLVADPADTYLWSNGDITQTTNIAVGGTYWVTINSANGCTASDTIVVNIATFPTAELGQDTSICAGDTVCFMANPDTTLGYAWTTGATTNSVCVASSGIYIVTVTNVFGCTTADTVLVSQPPPPLASVAFDGSGCPTFSFFGNSIGGPGSDWSWDFGDGGTDTSQNPSHTFGSIGVYNVQLTVSNACGWDTIVVEVPVSCEISTEAFLSGSLSLYPNPGTGLFWIETHDIHVKNADLTIRDAFGKTVTARRMGALTGDHLEAIDLSKFASGMYFLELNIGKERISRKLILEK